MERIKITQSKIIVEFLKHIIFPFSLFIFPKDILNINGTIDIIIENTIYDKIVLKKLSDSTKRQNNIPRYITAPQIFLFTINNLPYNSHELLQLLNYMPKKYN